MGLYYNNLIPIPYMNIEISEWMYDAHKKDMSIRSHHFYCRVMGLQGGGSWDNCGLKCFPPFFQLIE